MRGEGGGKKGAGLHTLDREAWLTGSGWSLSHLMKWGSSCPSPGDRAWPYPAPEVELSSLPLPQREAQQHGVP